MQDAQQLIIRAYREAQRSGKLDWRRMTTAVLKNRLLDLTDRRFDEARYGASSFMDFVSRYPDVVRVDSSVFPPIVELDGAEADRLSSTGGDYASPAYRIRPDLWQAALDYSSGTPYVWDIDTQKVIPGGDSGSNPIIDTVTATLQRQWRLDFLNQLAHTLDLTDAETGQTDEWVRLQLGTSRLPDRLIPQWNRFFRDRVRDHLSRWFSESKLEPPDDMVTPISKRAIKGHPETEDIRELVITVVSKMTHQELSRLSLPSEAVMRAMRQSRP